MSTAGILGQRRRQGEVVAPVLRCGSGARALGEAAENRRGSTLSASNFWMLRALTPDRSASASWVSPAPSRWARSKLPNVAVSRGTDISLPQM
jgi:hypothetical protein